MKGSDLLRLIGLFMRVARRRASRVGDVQRNAMSSHGMAYDLFRPKGRADATLIALHGGTWNGKDDPRLQHLAQCLAASGALCIVPTLPGLSRFQWIPDDIVGLVDLVDEFSSLGARVGLIGFSYGGSYALMAAAHPLVATRVGFVLSFGAYYSLGDLFRHQMTFGRTWPQQARDWDNWLYLQLAMARRHAARLPLAEAVIHELTDLLERYCHASTIEEKRTFYQRHLGSEVLIELEKAMMNDELCGQLSPAGKLNAIRCPVGLLHAAGDSLVPSEHARGIARELSASGTIPRMLVTDLLNHVDFSNAFNLAQWYRLATLLLPLVRRLPEEPS